MRNYVREEVEAMSWPETIADTEGDRVRVEKVLRRKLRFWRKVASLAIYLLAVSWLLFFITGEIK
jgi:hypothetical protein